MKFEEYQEKMELLKKWIEQKRTGSPKQLSSKLNVSDRTIRRWLEKLNDSGHCIRFCRISNSYIDEK